MTRESVVLDLVAHKHWGRVAVIKVEVPRAVHRMDPKWHQRPVVRPDIRSEPDGLISTVACYTRSLSYFDARQTDRVLLWVVQGTRNCRFTVPRDGCLHMASVGFDEWLMRFLYASEDRGLQRTADFPQNAIAYYRYTKMATQLRWKPPISNAGFIDWPRLFTREVVSPSGKASRKCVIHLRSPDGQTECPI